MSHAASSNSCERSGEREIHYVADNSAGLGADYKCIRIERSPADRDLLQDVETELEDHQLPRDEPKRDVHTDMDRNDRVSPAFLSEVSVDI